MSNLIFGLFHLDSDACLTFTGVQNCISNHNDSVDDVLVNSFDILRFLQLQNIVEFDFQG